MNGERIHHSSTEASSCWEESGPAEADPDRQLLLVSAVNCVGEEILPPPSSDFLILNSEHNGQRG